MVLDKCSKSLVFCLAFMMLFGCGNESSDPNVLRAAKAGYEAFQTGSAKLPIKTCFYTIPNLDFSIFK